MSLNRFRLPTASIPLYERRDASSNTQYKSSSPRTHEYDSDIIPLTGLSSSSGSTSSSSTTSSASPISRQKSFTIKSLNPRRLSMRLKSRSNPPSPSASEDKPKPKHTEPEERALRGGSEFIYKPITRQAYPTVVAETVAARRPASRYAYNYTPAAGRDTLAVPAPPVSAPRSRSRSRSRGALGDDAEGLYDDLNEWDYRGSSGAADRDRDWDLYTSAAERKRIRAARRLTTAMVPDADEIYG
ncbi:hypothetical protein BJX61DRAFT_543157 [Aspergillus egyptiacus]|nr:hypothetical protein BJX61DRAFT_543157 [Aspergillus egyptiacus]